MGFAEFSDQDSRWFSFCFHCQSCPENRSVPAVTKRFEIRRPNWTRTIWWTKQNRAKRDFFHDSDGRRENRHFRFPNPIHRAGSGIGKSHPFVRLAPSFRSLIAATNARTFFLVFLFSCFLVFLFSCFLVSAPFFCSTAPQAFFRPDRGVRAPSRAEAVKVGR